MWKKRYQRLSVGAQRASGDAGIVMVARVPYVSADSRSRARGMLHGKGRVLLEAGNGADRAT